MNTFRNVFILLLLTLFGCGQQLVEFPITDPPVVVITAPSDGAGGISLDTTVRAVFSKGMAGATLDTKTFTLTQGDALIPATVSYAGLTATLTPKSPLVTGASFKATITTGATDTQGTALSEDYSWTFTTRDGPDTTAPSVTFTYPADGVVDVPTGAQIHAAFSEVMNAATLTAATFTVTQGNMPVPGAVSYSKLEAVFTPEVSFLPGTVVTATITTGAQDLAGNALAADYVWSFTTSPLPDGKAPTVSFTDPANDAAEVPNGTQIHAAFSEVMNGATLTSATFTLSDGNVPVPGVVTYAGLTAIFNPDNALPASTLLTATITTGAQDLAGNGLAADYVWTFTTSPLPDGNAPTVTVTDPANEAVGVPVGTQIQAAFSEMMNAATLTNATFTVTQGNVPVPGVVTYAGLAAIFTPNNPLPTSTVFTATITTGAQDLVGNGLAANYVWTFTTSAAPDVGAPIVTFTDPSDEAVGVPVGTQIHAAFSEVMNAGTLNNATFTVTQGNVPVPGVVTYAGLAAIFTPNNALPVSTVFTATITTGAQDLVGNGLAANYVWTFTTSAAPDLSAPIVTFTDPQNNATGVDAGVKVKAAFSEIMDCATINAATFTLARSGVQVPGVVTCAGPNATFTPAAPLAGSPPTYTATITTGAKDMNGNGLLQDYVWTFEIGPKAGLAAVTLGAASSYAILAFNTVTNVNNPGTIVTGDLGISPGAALVGFPPGQVVGTIHAGDPIAAAAKVALLAAYNDAAGRLNPAVLPADLSGLTFSPGLYNNSTSVMHSSGNCTLDAKGDSNAVFIFQMGSTLTTNAATQIILSGGAKAANVFWAVGTSATLGTTSIFKGTILAASAITMQTGAVLEGRLLAQAAAVSLDTNVITVPAP